MHVRLREWQPHASLALPTPQRQPLHQLLLKGGGIEAEGGGGDHDAIIHILLELQLRDGGAGGQGGHDKRARTESFATRASVSVKMGSP